ncbi:MAG: HAD-IA family hydrolase [Pseudomonadales bacterium]|nr:HAD-IA family hydrolase [Pseudomonadales bacterium]
MIEAILWDFGGVLTTSPFEAFNRFERERGLPLDFIRRVNATNPEDNAWARFESSRIDLDAFDSMFAEESTALGHTVAGRDVVALLSGDIRPRMVEVLQVCKTRYRVACITNNVRSGHGPGMAASSERADRVAGVMGLFDLVVESSLEGIRKPDPRIYRLTCERLGVEPAAAVFLDDLGINLKPARELGMRTIKVVDEDQAIRELAAVTGLALP